MLYRAKIQYEYDGGVYNAEMAVFENSQYKAKEMIRDYFEYYGEGRVLTNIGELEKQPIPAMMIK